jgi:hypothetical protein
VDCAIGELCAAPCSSSFSVALTSPAVSAGSTGSSPHDGGELASNSFSACAGTQEAAPPTINNNNNHATHDTTRAAARHAVRAWSACMTSPSGLCSGPAKCARSRLLLSPRQRCFAGAGAASLCGMLAHVVVWRRGLLVLVLVAAAALLLLLRLQSPSTSAAPTYSRRW